MKRKMIAVLFLVGVCLGVLVVEGVSQPPSAKHGFYPAPPPPAAVNTSGGISVLAPNSDPTKPTLEPQQRVWTFEQLVQELEAVRAHQKALQAKEADLLAKIAEKVEEKRRDLSKSEEILQKLRGEPSNRPVSRMDLDRDKDKTALDKPDRKK